VLQEWLEHYVWQGASVFVLLDNNSTRPFDATPPAWAPADVVVDVRAAPRKHSQEASYNTVGAPALAAHGVDVVLVVDLDEFLFSTDRRLLRDVLAEALSAPKAARVCTHWTLFGSSHHVRQPPSVRLGFSWRASKLQEPYKCAARVADVTRYAIHAMDLRPGMEEAPAPPTLQLNHYPLQSREFFMGVKVTRGSAVATSEGLRDEGYFDRYNEISTDEEDYALARQVLQFYGAGMRAAAAAG
jgi:hypothetical protein